MSRYLVDTNVVSELGRLDPDPNVRTWAMKQDPETLFVSVLTIGELRRGISVLPPSARRSSLTQWLEDRIRPWFGDRILPIDTGVAECWGELTGQARLRGRGLPVIDGLLAATAVVHQLTVVTRNVGHLKAAGADVMDPWTDR